MSDPLKLLVTMAVGSLGGYCALKAKVPAGAMIGSLVFVSAFNVITGYAHIYSWMKIAIQIVSGMFIGMRITRADVKTFKAVPLPTIVMITVLMAFTAFLSVLTASITPMTLETSVFATAPGGLMEMTLLSLEYDNVDHATIPIMQTLRFVFVICAFPPMSRLIAKRMARREAAAAQALRAGAPGDAAPITAPAPLARDEKLRRMGFTTLVAVASGLLGNFLGIPVGALIFSMLFTGAYNVITDRAYMPVPVKDAAMVAAGAYVGMGVTLEVVLHLKYVALPALILVLGYTLITLVLAFVEHKFLKLDYMTAFFASCPGGATDISLLAYDMGANVPIVSVMQVARFLGVVTLYPYVINLLLKYL